MTKIMRIATMQVLITITIIIAVRKEERLDLSKELPR